MSNPRKIQSALISVYHKDRLDEILKLLQQNQVHIYSTGGTFSYIESKNIDVTAVEELTSYPSILGGRVKTLHPKIFGGILARRSHEDDLTQLKEYQIPEIDLVIVDLYPFQETLATGGTEQEIIEKIDIGGPSLIRAAAKNFDATIVVASRELYPDLINLLKEKHGYCELEDRKKFAAAAFKVTSGYDTAINNYFQGGGVLPSGFNYKNGPASELRYGENPHQKGVFFGDLDEVFEKLNGKELSYNNLVDVDAAVNLIAEFEETAFAIIKHTNPCGVALGKNVAEAYEKALAGDPLSAFGGILITNREVTEEAANKINELFFEVIIAPAFSTDALEMLKSRKNRIVLKQKNYNLQSNQFRSILNGVLQQETDVKIIGIGDLKNVTDSTVTDEQAQNMIFANKIVKHLKSNAIAIVSEKQLIGAGCGQTSRVDAVRHAIEKTKAFNFRLDDAVLASDAFFPFSDSVEIAHRAGIKAFIQPGGSVKDKDSIDYCNTHGLTMVFTGTRHFKH